MIWYPSKSLPFYYSLFCDDKMKQVSENATLYSHLSYSKNNDEAVESESENGNDAIESESKSNDDAVESEVYNGTKSKKDFLYHINRCSTDCNKR